MKFVGECPKHNSVKRLQLSARLLEVTKTIRVENLPPGVLYNCNRVKNLRYCCVAKGGKQPTPTIQRKGNSQPRVTSHVPFLLLTFLICSSRYSRRLMRASDHLSLTQFKSSSWHQEGKTFSCKVHR